MGVRMVFDKVQQDGRHVWTVQLPPHQVQMFGAAKITLGQRSVLIAKSPIFDSTKATLEIDVDTIVVANQGTTPETLVVDVGSQKPESPYVATINVSSVVKRPDAIEQVHGPGDQEFLALVRRELSGESRTAAEEVLRRVRSVSAGDLKRGKRRNFQNAPDNFWYAVLQPRAQNVSITVRGAPSRFLPSQLELKDDRPGYTRFLLSKPSEVEEAIRIIEQSKRR